MSNNVTVRLNEELEKEVEYLVKVANEQSNFVGSYNKSDVIRFAIKHMANHVRENGGRY